MRGPLKERVLLRGRSKVLNWESPRELVPKC
uniref:Uncharacterized protein n=1 Tax=Arcella intermedia TaxID=1963864 RepID=A0A6B2LYG4_9EUKA